MSEPPVLLELLPGLLMLRDRDSWSGCRSRRTGYAVRLREGGLVLIDPPPLEPEACALLEALGPPTHILLTCNWHLRGGEEHRRRWGCPVLVHEAGLATAETAIDGTFRTGDRLWDAVDIVQQVTELGWPEEAVLLLRLERPGQSPRRCLYVGDAVCGGRDDIGLPGGEVGQYTMMGRSREEIRRTIADVPKARGALERLLRHDFDALAFGHGAPVLSDPHAALRRFLAREDLWGTAAGPTS